MAVAGASLGDRSLFPHLEAKVYFNHAAISPASTAILDTIRDVPMSYAQKGAAAFPMWMAQRERLRGKLATLVGANTEEIALMPNTTRGVVDIALSHPWKSGDRVVVFEGEFPANVTPWQQAAAAFGLEIVRLPVSDFARPDGPDFTRLDAVLARGVALIAVSAVQFQTGLRSPVRAIADRAHSSGAALFVDAVQSCGVVPTNVHALGADYLACGSHKWLMGLEGAGFLFARSERAAALRPLTAGWLSHQDGLRFLFEGKNLLRYDRPLKTDISVLEGGNYNGVGLAALEVSIDVLQSIGIDSIYGHVQTIHDALEKALVARGFTSLRSQDPARRSGILSVYPPEPIHVIALQKALGDRGIACSTPDGALRFSPHYCNDMGQVEVLVAALDDALSSLRSA